jgi:transposase
LEELWTDKETAERDRKRLSVIRAATVGTNTHRDLAEIAGCAHTAVTRYLKKFEEGGFAGLLERGKPKPPETPMRQSNIQEEIHAGLLAGQFRSARKLQDWLLEKHGIKRTYWAAYYWLKEFGAKLLVPRPVHRKKDPEKTAAFPAQLTQILEQYREILASGRPIRIWIQDEARIGLHTLNRRAWGLPGHRIVIPSQRKYQWNYVYGALEIGTGRIETLIMSGVSLDFSKAFLNYLRETEPEAEHIVIWDGAGFHQKQGKHELPEHVHVIQLPPYSPELNPIEKLWDIIKDGLCNRIFETLEELKLAVEKELQVFYDSSERVMQLLGKCITVALANAS